MKRKILVIAAHPDDDILGCGGTLSKLKKKYIIKVFFLAEGTSCRFSDLSKKKEIQKEIDLREKQAKKALKILGVNLYKFNNFPCGRLDSIPVIEINKKIENEIDNFKPNIIFTHSENDCNNDHKIIFKSVMMASRPNNQHTVEELYSFEVLSSTEWNFSNSFNPNYFQILNKKNIQDKWKAFKNFKSEIHKFPLPRTKSGIFNLAKVRGSQIGSEYAEAFKLIRSFKK
tara:strand:+ start:2674 stop:3360 length:687 start_codon:yes stop_codon:yes gene_type:complete